MDIGRLFTRHVTAGIVFVSLLLAGPVVAGGDPPPVIVEIQSVSKFYACGERVLAFMIENVDWPPVIKLVKDGEPDIVAEHMNFDGDYPNGQIQCIVQIDEQTAGGLWSVVLTNPDNHSSRVEDAVEVVPNCPRGRVGDLYVASDAGRNGVEDWWPEGPEGPRVENPHWGHGNVLQFDEVTADFICNFAFGGGEDDLDWLVTAQDLAWGPNGNLFVCDARHIDDIGNVALGGKVIEYDGRSGAYVRTFVPVFSGGLEIARSLAFGGPDGNLYVHSPDPSDGVFEYDGKTGEFVRIAFRPFADFGFQVNEINFSPNGNMLLLMSVGSSGPSFVEMGFNPDTGEWELVRVILEEFLADRYGLAFEADHGSWVICRDNDGVPGEVDRVIVESGEIVETVVVYDPGDPMHLDTPQDLAYGPGGHLFVCGTHTNVVPRGNDGAMHEYDPTSIPFEPVRVFAWPHGLATERQAIEGEVIVPRHVEFKPLPGDYGGKQAGGDWDVDLFDYARFFDAFTGPGAPCNDPLARVAFDQDRDGDIDYADFGAFQRHFGKTVEDYR